MNADYIFKKYVLKETEIEWVEPPEDPRGTGRTSKLIISLTPNSIYVCDNLRESIDIKNMAITQLRRWDPVKHTCDVGFISLDEYLCRATFAGQRAYNGEMVAFDHVIYEKGFTPEQYQRLQDVNQRAYASGFNVIFDESYYNKLHPAQ